MKRSWLNVLFYMIILLGIIGLISTIFTDPMALLVKLLIGAAIIGVIFFLYKHFSASSSTGDKGAYQRAVKQSRKRHKDRVTPRNSHLKVVKSRPLAGKRPLDQLKSREATHLTVIDGKKKRRKKLFFLQ